LEILYEPYTSIIVHEIIKGSIENLVQVQSLGIPAKQTGRAINWADGIAFIYSPMPPTDEIVREELKGRMHWSHLAFAFMPAYKPEMTTSDGNVKIPIINVSANLVFKDLAKWIKEKFKE
jgi:hypothetical protein